MVAGKRRGTGSKGSSSHTVGSRHVLIESISDQRLELMHRGREGPQSDLLDPGGVDHVRVGLDPLGGLRVFRGGGVGEDVERA
jgi:hypothetical protein